MTLVPYYRRPASLFEQLHREMDQLFANQGATTEDAQQLNGMASWAPAVDISEDEHQYSVRADIPGVDPKEINVTFENGVLTISGKRESTVKSDEKDKYRRVERVYGFFKRSFALPDSVDPERIQASGKNGVLEIALPKSERVKPKKITVQ